MIITLGPTADIDAVRARLIARGLWLSAFARPRGSSSGEGHFVVAEGSSRVTPEEVLRVEGVVSVSVAPSAHPRIDAQGPSVHVGEVTLGGSAPPVFMCGPCCVESEGQIHDLAARIAPLGAGFLRGGAFKPRSSPYAFQGHGRDALRWMRSAADAHGLKVVTEALSEGDTGAVAELADMVQIGSRNMQNYALLKAVGRSGRPALLKRAMSATVEEWLLAAEYLLQHGSSGVVLCERGVRGYDPSTRNLLDLGAVALLAHVHHLPVVVDPSHATGRKELVLPLAKAALAAGAAGVMIETHEDPGHALSDGPQALLPSELAVALKALGARKTGSP